MPPYLGGHRMREFAWQSSHSLAVRFESTWGTLYYYQLYAGRILIGVSTGRSARRIVGQLTPHIWPHHLTLLAVHPSQRTTDYGRGLPLRPYHRARLRFTCSGWPADAKQIDVFAGTTPGGAVDPNNRIGRVPFDGDREYEFVTPPLAGSGTWNFEVKGVDDKPLDGNSGPALAIQAGAILAHPPDVQLIGGARFALSISGAQATATFTEP